MLITSVINFQKYPIKTNKSNPISFGNKKELKLDVLEFSRKPKRELSDISKQKIQKIIGENFDYDTIFENLNEEQYFNLLEILQEPKIFKHQEHLHQ